MIIKYIGSRMVSFKSEKGDLIDGTTLYYAHEAPGVDGLMTDKMFVRKDMQLPSLKAGDNLTADFDNHGKLISIKKA